MRLHSPRKAKPGYDASIEFRLNTHRAMTGTQQAKALDEKADEAFAAGVSAGQTSDSYVRVTVFLASVLFLVGISSDFPRRVSAAGSSR